MVSCVYGVCCVRDVYFLWCVRVWYVVSMACLCVTYVLPTGRACRVYDVCSSVVCLVCAIVWVTGVLSGVYVRDWCVLSI